jgi:hypothetical protein
MIYLFLSFGGFAFLLLQVLLVEVLGLVQRHHVGNEVRQRAQDGHENLLLDAADGLEAVAEAVERAGRDVARHDHDRRGLLRLGHRREDKHGRDGLEVDAELGVLDAHRVGEVAAEGLRATVRAEVGGRHRAVGRRDGDDGAGLGVAHVGQDVAGEAEDGLAVDVEDVDLVLRGEGAEGLVVGVGEADVVDEDRDLELGELLEELCVLGLVVGREVEGKGEGLDLVLGLDVGAEVVEDVLAARDDDDVEAALGKLDGVRLADAGGRARDDGPLAGLAVLGLEVGLDEEVDAEEAEELESQREENNGSDDFENALEANHYFNFFFMI